MGGYFRPPGPRTIGKTPVRARQRKAERQAGEAMPGPGDESGQALQLNRVGGG